MIDLIWIKRISEEEDEWLEENLATIDRRFRISVVGHTRLDHKQHRFNYYEFWEDGIDALGLICHKKNVGVKNANQPFCLVLHSDVSPASDFYDKATAKAYDANKAVCPISFVRTIRPDPFGNMLEVKTRSFSWCDISLPMRQKENMVADENTYISGAGIFGQTEMFKKYQWNETLSHAKEEDVAYSRYLRKNGIELIYDPELVLDARRSQ